MSDHAPRYRAGPALGGDGPAILAELGYRPEELGWLRESGAFGADVPVL
jgi:hypothetical protein